MSNNLELRSRRFSIRHLRPETDYELRVRANNEAGSSERVFAFETVSRNAAGERLGEGSSLDSRGEGGEAGSATAVVVPAIVGVLLSIAAIFSGVVLLKRRELFCPRQIQGGPSGFRVFHCLPNSAWADGNLAEGAGQVGKMVEHRN